MRARSSAPARPPTRTTRLIFARLALLVLVALAAVGCEPAVRPDLEIASAGWSRLNWGVRAVSGEKTAFAYSDDISLASLLDAARTVRAISSVAQTGRVRVPAKKIATSRSLYQGVDPIASLDSTAKVALLERLEQRARAKDPRVAQVMAGLASEYDVVLVARADGTLAADVRPLVRLSITGIAEQNSPREVGSSGGAGPAVAELLRRGQDLVAEFVREPVRLAVGVRHGRDRDAEPVGQRSHGHR